MYKTTHSDWFFTGTATVFVCVLALVAAALQPQAAYAQTLDDLQLNYQAAVIAYEDALQAQDQTIKEFDQVEARIEDLEKDLDTEERSLEKTAVTLYKEYPNGGLVDILLAAESFDDLLTSYDYYQRIQKYYVEAIQATNDKREQLAGVKTALQAKKEQLVEEVRDARMAVSDAEYAYWDADHSDGAQYHQRQVVGNNCGATAFIVGVNTLLHENRFTDNVAVWSGPGFAGDSTTSLAYKGAVWLASYGLSDQIGIEEIVGDIHTVDQMRSELEQGHVVVTSSGAGSVWHYADGSAIPGLFPYGHWIVFYHYADGVFYANDSSTGAKRGAGCPYSEADLQQWLNGRGNHFSVSLWKK